MAAVQIICPSTHANFKPQTSNLKLKKGRQGTATSADKLPLLPLGPGGVGLPKIHGPWRPPQSIRPRPRRNLFRGRQDYRIMNIRVIRAIRGSYSEF